MAIKTGISPLDLLKTPPAILSVMIEHIWPRANIKTGAEAWQELASMATG